jgi:methylglutaconyl-CoA hydratase
MLNLSIEDSKPDNQLCELSIEGPVATIRLNRAQKHNALNVQLIGEIITSFEWCAERSVAAQGALADAAGHPLLRVVVLTHAGRNFCAGADIGWMRAAGSQTAEENRADASRLDNLFHSIWSHPCFTIATVNGVALGGGVGLLAACDQVIADSGAKLALSEAKLGILPAVIGPYVYRRTGSAGGRRLAQLAGRISAAEAHRVGLVDLVSRSEQELQDSLTSIISEVLTTGPGAVAEAKSLFSSLDSWTGSEAELREFTLDVTTEMRASAEGQEGLSAFLQGRAPDWKVDWLVESDE